MIRVLVLYPRVDNSRFDAEYFKNHHIPLVQKLLKPRTLEVSFGITAQGYEAPFIAVTHMTFGSWEQLAESYQRYGQELLQDKEVFTDLEITSQISDVAELS